MQPKLKSDDGKHIVIRPLAYCKEQDIKAYAEQKEFPIIPCSLCGAQNNLQRQVIKEMLDKWDSEYKGRSENIFAAIQNIVPSHLADIDKFDFSAFMDLKQQKLPVWLVSIRWSHIELYFLFFSWKLSHAWIFFNPENGCLFMPYDGGADFIVNSSEVKNEIKLQYSNWRSDLSSGM